MKKLILFAILINSIIFGNTIYSVNDIFIKNGKGYLLKDDKELTGVVLKSIGDFKIYTSYEKGVMTKEKILDSNGNTISDYFLDAFGLINGLFYIELDTGETIKANYKRGMVDGIGEQTFYEDFDFEGNFSYGIAHGKVEAIDINGKVKEYNYSQGVQNNKLEKPLFEEYFNKDFTPKTALEISGDTAKKSGKDYTGMAYKGANGLLSEGIFYSNGIKKAEFYFAEGFMYLARVHKNKNSYEEYLFYEEMNKGVLYSYSNYENGKLTGLNKVYYINGDREEKNYKDNQPIGKNIVYDLGNKILEITEYNGDNYKKTSYFDYEKNKIRLITQGTYNKEYMEWRKIGKEIRYFENGKIEEEVIFDRNTASSTIYYPSGKIRFKGNIDIYTEYYTGIVEEYYESGNIKAKYNYSEGYLDGTQTYYDEKGSIIKIEEYDYGYLLD